MDKLEVFKPIVLLLTPRGDLDILLARDFDFYWKSKEHGKRLGKLFNVEKIQFKQI